MSINKKKIRREIMLNGEKVWITADTEQEYINKVLRLSGSINSSAGEKHNFREYAQKWFDTTLRLKQQKLRDGFFALARKDPAGLLAASQWGLTQPERKRRPKNCWINLRGVLHKNVWKASSGIKEILFLKICFLSFANHATV